MIPLTQLHLDFHTAPSIHPIAQDFSPEQFAETIQKAHIESVNVFAKCHHGMCYHPTKVGVMHPGLSFDLFGEMLSALKSRSIRTVAYVPIGWEEEAAKNINWVEIDQRGVIGGKSPLENGYYQWRKLCLNKREYIAYIKSYIDELLANYEFDGFWFDIVRQYGCICDDCRKGMRQMGLSPDNPGDVRKYGLYVTEQFQKEITQYVKEKKDGLSLYYNGGWKLDDAFFPAFSTRNLFPSMTHMEIESLPSEQWGYNHFPLQVNYCNRENRPVVGMNGIFHTAWGDHGSLRNREALEFESFRMLANGACCCVGDQLHPRGELNPTVYKRIGEVYAEVLKRKEWCQNSSKDSEVAVLLANRVPETEYSVEEGALRILTELHIPFDLIDRQDPLSSYQLLILPDEIYFDRELTQKVQAFLENGGKIIATCHSGLNEQKTGFALDFGLEYHGEMEYTPIFMQIEDAREAGIEPMKYVSRYGSTKVSAQGASVFSSVWTPYFNRTYDNFSSHRHFPYDKKTDFAAIAQYQNIVYIAAPVFGTYIEYGEALWRQLIALAMQKLHYRPKVCSDLPPHCEVTVRRQPGRTIIHVLNYFYQRKSRQMDIVDSMLPLHNRHIRLRSGAAPKQVYLAPQNTPCTFEMRDGYCEVLVPKLSGHTMVVLEWEEA